MRIGQQQDEREFWEEVAESSLHLRMKNPATSDQTYRRLVERFFHKWIDTTKTQRVLKLDAYNEATHTSYSYYFLERKINVAYAEISLKIIKKAVNKIERDGYIPLVHPVQCDFRQLPFRDDAFDASCSFGSVEHVEEVEKSIQEQARVTKRGGTVIVAVPNLQNLFLRAASIKLLDFFGLLSDFTNMERHFLPNQLASILRRLNLNSIEISGYHLFPKQLRWLDLWNEWWGSEKIRKIMRKILKNALTIFEAVELRETKMNLLAEMLIAKATK
ncbi:MAG: class I SAM-dependent methyltransferase [Nitrososphaerota archaeon]